MENYIDSIIICFVIGCLFYLYILVLRKNFLKLQVSMQQLEEALLSSDNTLIFNASGETAHQFKDRFDQLVMTPIYTACSFIGMFTTSKRRHRYTVMILQLFRFPEHMSRIIEHRLTVTKTAWDFVKFYSTINAESHPKMIQDILRELTDPDLQYKIEKWQALSPENV